MSQTHEDDKGEGCGLCLGSLQPSERQKTCPQTTLLEDIKQSE